MNTDIYPGVMIVHDHSQFLYTVLEEELIRKGWPSNRIFCFPDTGKALAWLVSDEFHRKKTDCLLFHKGFYGEANTYHFLDQIIHMPGENLSGVRIGVMSGEIDYHTQWGRCKEEMVAAGADFTFNCADRISGPAYPDWVLNILKTGRLRPWELASRFNPDHLIWNDDMAEERLARIRGGGKERE